MKARTLLAPAAVFLAAFAYFHLLQFSAPNIPGFDGYYHIKFAEITRNEGIVKSFPWFQQTYWKDYFVDQHFLFHLLLVPFTHGDLTQGAKTAAVVFCALMVSVFHTVLRGARVPCPWAWTVVLSIGSPEFLYRMALPRAPVLALALLFLGFYSLYKKNRLGLFFLGFVFVWLYGGFTLLVVFAGLWFLSERVLEKKLDRPTIYVFISGILAGLIVNPYFPENIAFIYTQTFAAGIDRAVEGGQEWLPYRWEKLLEDNWIPAALFVFSSGFFAAARRPPRVETSAWVLFSAAALLLTLGSRRFIEYLVPCLAVASALLFRDGWEILRQKSFFSSEWVSPAFLAAFLMLVPWLAPDQFAAAKKEMEDTRDPERYKQAALWLEKNTPGSTIYLTDWDDFPELFFYNSRNRYIVGLDPAFLYIYDPYLHKKWIEINSGTIRQDPYLVLLYLFRTPYIYTDNEHGPFIRLMEGNPRIKLEYQDAHGRIYGLKRKQD
ncbi:MAG: hypothetical protein HY579_05000 [Nitrospinae bacterium]|nr:hypothetical protein [Nitrospinota bacterium]